MWVERGPLDNKPLFACISLSMVSLSIEREDKDHKVVESDNKTNYITVGHVFHVTTSISSKWIWMSILVILCLWYLMKS